MLEMISALGGAFITTSGLVIIGWWQHGKFKRIETQTRATKEQVQNSHKTNLRDDLDVLRALLEKLVHDVEHAETERKRLAAKQELAALQAQIEHTRLWDAITGGEPPMPSTTETEIIDLKLQKEEEND